MLYLKEQIPKYPGVVMVFYPAQKLDTIIVKIKASFLETNSVLPVALKYNTI